MGTDGGAPRGAASDPDHGDGTVAVPPAWRVEAFVASLTSLSEHTVDAYRRDVVAFVEWAGRLGLSGPQDVDRRTLRRYLGYLSTRRYASRSVARKASAL